MSRVNGRDQSAETGWAAGYRANLVPLRARRRREEAVAAAAGGDKLPTFPEAGWRGVFADYRDAMAGTTEASDVAHFATLWTAAAVALNRGVWMWLGDTVYSNVYISFFGPTGDRKTTAARRLQSCKLLVSGVRLVRDVGSTEGLSRELQGGEGADENDKPAEGAILFLWEELASLLSRGRWTGSTIFEFLTQLFDCPPSWALKYATKPVELQQPTPSILCGSTPSWFWKYARPEDFFGGFGNRVLFLSGAKKSPIPNPRQPDERKLEPIRDRLHQLAARKPHSAHWASKAAKLWERFYVDWESAKRPELLAAALKRTPTYTAKLAMVYAALEGTLPEITAPQLEAAIAVCKYAAACTQQLLDARVLAQASPEQELEQRIVKWVHAHEAEKLRNAQQALQRYAGSAERFHRAVKALQAVGAITVNENKVVTSGG